MPSLGLLLSVAMMTEHSDDTSRSFKEEDEEMNEVVEASNEEEEDIVKDTESEEEEEEESGSFHHLFLPARWSYQAPIVFSDGMNYNECQEHYRLQAEEEAGHEEACRRGRYCSLQNLFGRGRGGFPRKIPHKVVELPAEFDMDVSEEGAVEPTKPMEGDTTSSVTDTVSCTDSETTTASIRFKETVTVHAVPAIEDYPVDVWNSTWKPSVEVRAHKRRSRKEYAWDRKDWKNATEEGMMVRDPETGLLEHPVHYQALR